MLTIKKTWLNIVASLLVTWHVDSYFSRAKSNNRHFLTSKGQSELIPFSINEFQFFVKSANDIRHFVYLVQVTSREKVSSLNIYDMTTFRQH